jgi:hypothetical protein
MVEVVDHALQHLGMPQDGVMTSASSGKTTVES